MPDLLDSWRFTNHGLCIGTCTINREASQGYPIRDTTLIMNGADPNAQEHLLSGIQLQIGEQPGLIDSFDVQQFDTAMIVRYRDTVNWLPPKLTSAAHARDGSLKLFRGREFGTMWLPPLAAAYAILFQLSMLVRYYPDIWMHAVESRSLFALLVEEVIEELALDVPVLVAEQIFDEKVFRPSEASSLDWR
jgi:hypothetical protein